MPENQGLALRHFANNRNANRIELQETPAENTNAKIMNIFQ